MNSIQKIQSLIIKAVDNFDGSLGEGTADIDLALDTVLIGGDHFDSFSLVSLFVALEMEIETNFSVSLDVTTNVLAEAEGKKTVEEVCETIILLLENAKLR